MKPTSIPANPAGILAMLAVLLLAGCRGGGGGKLKVGSKDLTEQKLLAEMMALAAEAEGIRVEREIPYGGSRKCLAALQRGVIDAYPEYDGTLLALSGVPPGSADPAELAGRNGMRWLDPFGPDSRFGLAVRRDLALRHGLASISDLQRIPGGPRFGVEEDFLARPVDGLYPMARRYGLTVKSVSAFGTDEPAALYDALLERRVDVAEVFSTDGWLAAPVLRQLEDDLGFFSPYRAGPLVREEALGRFPELESAWGALAGTLDSKAMRALNQRVQLGGEDYRDVARDHLVSLEILPPVEATARGRSRVRLAVSPFTDQNDLPIRAADAIRTVMPARHLLVEKVPDPAEAVRQGQARFGLVGAESLFELADDGTITAVDDLEAVGVVGTRLVHVIAAGTAGPPETWKRIGVGDPEGASGRVARFLLAALELDDKIELVTHDDPGELAAALAEGEIDARLVMAQPGHHGITEALQESSGRLVSLDIFRGGVPALRYPFLRQAQIPANTYPGQAGALPSLAGQAVLATRVPPGTETRGEVGPGLVPGVITRLPQRLAPATARRLSQALDSAESIDPTLPASPGLLPETPSLRPRLEARPGAALLNAFAVAFLTGMVILWFRRLPDRPAMRPGTRPPEADA